VSASGVDGKVALVTGVGRRAGIGAAIARELGRAGASVFVSFHAPYHAEGDPGEPWAIVEELRQADIPVEACEIDLADAGAPARLVAEAYAAFGALDVLVNNAAHSVEIELDSLDAATLDQHYAVNVRATALLCAEFARRRAALRGGRIVNLTSGQGLHPMPWTVAYAVTKGAVDALTLTLSAALAPRGITVNAVDPGPTDTGWMSPGLRRELEKASPLGRVGSPDDAARLVRFLASDEAGWVTGQIIRSRGGIQSLPQ
jgi:3-oxoacyl-[acyl-carrier protein] reductase